MDPGSNVTSNPPEISIMGGNSSKLSPAQNPSSNGTTDDSETMANTANDDSDSDVSMSAETDDEDEDIHTPIIYMNDNSQATEQPTAMDISTPEPNISKERKSSDSVGTMSKGHCENGIAHGISKHLKPDDLYQQCWTPEGCLFQDRSLLPAEIWHHIFTFTPPRVLGQLLQVNKKFHAYLDSSSSEDSIVSLSNSTAQLLKPDAIWQASRRLFRPAMPPPLMGISELDMWRLACCVSCQFCGKKRQPSHIPQMDQWHPGPGQNGVIPIWSFAVRTCGPCLQQKTSKEIDLLLSSTFLTPLMAALPFVFLTNELHVIPPTVLQKAGGPPNAIQINKHFFQAMAEDIKQELLDVNAKMGAATAEEWLKGLDNRGKERRNDAARWERWEAGGGVLRMRRNEPHEAQKFNVEIKAIPPATAIPNLPPVPPPSTNIPTLPQTNQYYPLPQPIQTAFPTNPPPMRYDSPSQNGITQYPPGSQPKARHERTKEEVAEMKAARRAEIERRSMLLDPPLTPGVLAHMSSYQAAIQIIQPLTDAAWEVLKPRLLSQREEAEQREKDRIAQTRVVQERFDASRWQGAKVEDSKEVIEREWEDVQAPLRSRIGGYADEIIRDGWNGGEKVTRDNCTTFAAEVLVYVRKRFYAEIAKDEAASRAAGQTPAVDPPNGPFTRKLILENMKWIFDTKIKPITEQYRKELFLCNDCDGNFKYYGFEGVIQHFAAKHTTALSLGSVVVHWKSEWPEYPPFKPDPNTVSNSYYNAAPSASDPYGQPGQQNYGYSGYHQPGPVSAPVQVPNLHAYQESPAPFYGHPQYGDQYSGHQNGPYAPPPQPYMDSSQGYQEMQYSAPPLNGNTHGYSQGPQDYPQQAYAPHYPVAVQGPYESPHPGPVYPASAPDNVGQQTVWDPQGSGYGASYHQPPAYQNGHFQQGSNSTRPPQTAEYKAQLLDVAIAARDVWKIMNGVKEIPGSVKVFTIIYHILKKSRAKYQNDPPLSMISDGLNNNKDMRQVRNINGLLCRACVLGMAGSARQEKKHFSLPQLVNHFHSVHEVGVSENGLGHVPDWTQDMVELPGSAKLAAVACAPGMDDKKLKVFAEALPEIVEKPATNTQEERYTEPISAFEDSSMHGTYDQPVSHDNHDKYYKKTDNSRQSDLDSGNYQGSYDQYGYVDDRPARDLVAQRSQERRQPAYEDLSSRHYIEQSAVPVQVRTIDSRGRYIIREEAPLYLDRAVHYRDVERVEHRGRSSYDPADPALSNLDYRQTNSQSYRTNTEDLPTAMARIAEQQKISSASRDVHFRGGEPAIPQHNPITEVITELARATKVKKESLDAGSEDGELPAEPGSRPETAHLRPVDEASRAAERFLNDFLPSSNTQDQAKRPEETKHPREDERRGQWEVEQGARRVYHHSPEPQRRVREGYEDESRFIAGRPANQIDDIASRNGYVVHERVGPQARQVPAYEHDDRYVETIPAQAIPRERSPELVDRRFKLNNVVYREERQSSQGMHRTPSRYARYESVRLENDRARSRSPVYVKVGTQPGQYRERSPVHSLQQEPVYRRSPQGPPDDAAYERAPRQEYYRVYADEPRQRQPAPQYAEAFEYVQVSDPDGDYMIRRPVRREPEHIYVDRATYEDEVYSRQPVYETRRPAPMSRSDPAYYEEYDPRHPAPPPATTAVRQVRYE